MSKHFSRLSRRRIAQPLLLLGALAASGCGGTDGTMLLQPAGGSGGMSAGGAAGGGSGGAAGAGGSAEPTDAGPDATSDAASAAPSCAVGALDPYCALGAGYCPATYAEAREKSREPLLALRPLLILQQACSAPDGSQRIRVSTVYPSLSRSFIFEPNAERLVSVQLYDDTGGCGASLPPSDSRFGEVHGFYGEDLPGCSFSYADVQVPSGCSVPPDWREADAGAPRDAGADAGTGPYECILAP